VAHQQVGSSAERRVGGDAGIAVRAAALQADGDVRRGYRLALRLVDLRQQIADARDALGDGLPGAAGLLDRHGLEQAALVELLGAHDAADLRRLAAQPDHDHRGEVGMARIAGDGAAEHVHAVALARHAAAGLVGECDDAVDVGERREQALAGDRVRPERFGDIARRRRRAVHRGEHADIVARRDAPVAAHDALEGRRLVEILRRLGERGVRVVAREIADLAIVGMHVRAGRDRGGGEADDLAIAQHRLVLGDGARRDLVPGRDVALRLDLLVGQGGAGQQVDPRDGDVVGRVEADRQLHRGHRSTSPVIRASP
jgi:hypothetical protein